MELYFSLFLLFLSYGAVFSHPTDVKISNTAVEIGNNKNLPSTDMNLGYNLVPVYEIKMNKMPSERRLCTPYCHREIYDKPVYLISKSQISDRFEVIYIADGLKNFKPNDKLKIFQTIGKSVAIVFTKYDFPGDKYPHITDTDISDSNTGDIYRETPYVVITNEQELIEINRDGNYEKVAEMEISTEGFITKIKMNPQISITNILRTSGNLQEKQDVQFSVLSRGVDKGIQTDGNIHENLNQYEGMSRGYLPGVFNPRPLIKNPYMNPYKDYSPKYPYPYSGPYNYPSMDYYGYPSKGYSSSFKNPSYSYNYNNRYNRPYSYEPYMPNQYFPESSSYNQGYSSSFKNPFYPYYYNKYNRPYNSFESYMPNQYYPESSSYQGYNPYMSYSPSPNYPTPYGYNSYDMSNNMMYSNKYPQSYDDYGLEYDNRLSYGQSDFYSQYRPYSPMYHNDNMKSPVSKLPLSQFHTNRPYYGVSDFSDKYSYYPGLNYVYCKETESYLPMQNPRTSSTSMITNPSSISITKPKISDSEFDLHSRNSERISSLAEQLEENPQATFRTTDFHPDVINNMNSGIGIPEERLKLNFSPLNSNPQMEFMQPRFSPAGNFDKGPGPNSLPSGYISNFQP